MEEGAPAAPAPSGRGLWIAIAVVIIVVVVVVAAIFAAPLLFPAGPEPVIGTVVPLTGDLERFGPGLANGGTLAVKHINDQGGVLGRTLRIIHEDTATDAAEGVSAARKLVDIDGAQALIGAAASAVSQPILEGVSNPGKIVQISPASTSPFFTTFNEAIAAESDRFFFRTAASDALQGKVAASYAFNDLGWRNVAILARFDTYGQGLAGTFETTFLSFAGTTVTQRVNYDAGLPSYSTEIDTIFASNPDGIYWVAFPTEGLIMMQEWWADAARRGMGWLGADGVRDAPFWGDVAALGIDTSNQEGTAPVASLGVASNADQFTADYTAEFGVAPTTFSSNVYDAVFLIAMAMEAGGSAAAQTIRDNLAAVSSSPGTIINYGDWEAATTAIAAGRGVDYEGASGSVNFDAFGDVGSDYEVWIYNEASGALELKQRILEADIPQSPPLLTSAATLLVAWVPLLATRD